MLSNTRCPGNLFVGDYVFASRWSDCDWNDPWAVGYVLSLGDNYVTVGNEDKTINLQIGTQSWRYAMLITKEQGERIIAQYPVLEGSVFYEDAVSRIFGKFPGDKD